MPIITNDGLCDLCTVLAQELDRLRLIESRLVMALLESGEKCSGVI